MARGKRVQATRALVVGVRLAVPSWIGPAAKMKRVRQAVPLQPARSNNLEIPRQLPIRHGAPEFAHFPLARGAVVLHKIGAKVIARYIAGEEERPGFLQ